MQPAVTDIRLAAAVTDIWLAAAVTDTWLAGCSCHRQQLAGCLSPGKPLRFKAVFEVTAAAHLSAAHAVRMCATLNHSEVHHVVPLIVHLVARSDDVESIKCGT